MYTFVMDDNPTRTRVIDISRSGVQTVPAQIDEDYDIQAAGVAETVQQGQDLWIYQDGELRAVVQDYYAYHSAAPVITYAAMPDYTLPAETPTAPAHITATPSTYNSSGSGSPGALPFVIGGLALAGGAAALAAGGGSKKDHDNDNDHTATPSGSSPNTPLPIDDPARHNGSVNDSRFAGDRSPNSYYFIQALNSDSHDGHLANHVMGQPLTVRYHFATDAYDRIGGFYLSGFRVFSEAQKADIRAAMAEISRHSNVRFVEASAADATLHFYLDDLTIAQAGHSEDSIVTGYARYGGDVHLSVKGYAADDAFRQGKQYVINGNGDYYPAGWATLVHEIGHSIGLTHPFGDQNSERLPRSENLDTLTLMSYTEGRHGRVDFNLNGEHYYYPDAPLSATRQGIYDLITLHYRYGVNPNYHSGDDTYHFRPYNPNTLGNDIYIMDGGGQDMLDASDQQQNLYLDLTPGSWNYAGSSTTHLVLADSGLPSTGQLFIGYGTQIESAKGGTGHDTIKGNSAANYLFGYDGNDRIDGGAGNDQIEGGRGADTLTGGRGADTFRFASPLDGTHDTITDFNLREGDLLEFDHNIYTSLQTGTLNAGQFVKGAAAQDADDHIIYNPGTGELSYDPDGNGTAAAVLIANIGRDLELSANHIHII